MSKNKERQSGLLGNGGFTLIEIVVAMCILSIALLGMIAVTAMVVKGNSFSKSMTTATTLAKDRIEVIKNTSYASLSGGSDSQSIYTRTWTVTNNSPATGMATVEVAVQWNWQGAPHNVTLRTIVAQ